VLDSIAVAVDDEAAEEEIGSSGSSWAVELDESSSCPCSPVLALAVDDRSAVDDEVSILPDELSAVDEELVLSPLAVDDSSTSLAPPVLDSIAVAVDDEDEDEEEIGPSVSPSL